MEHELFAIRKTLESTNIAIWANAVALALIAIATLWLAFQVRKKH